MKMFTFRRHSGFISFGTGVVLISVLMISACSGGSTTAPTSSGSEIINVVAAENFWVSIAGQVGGSHVAVTSIINNPNADPHTYEPISQDAKDVANAQYVIVNGAGYDAWMDKLIAANPSSTRLELNIGDFFGKKAGDNPHMWYNSDYVASIIGKIRDDLKTMDPADANSFDTSAQQYLDSGLKQYFSIIDDIKSKYSSTPVGASESIFAYMAPALGLNLITPISYMNAVSEGADVSASDEAMVEQQIDQKQIKIFVYNSQNTPPNIQILLGRAKAEDIPTPTITETLVPATATFQDWQTTELQGIENALRQATGK